MCYFTFRFYDFVSKFCLDFVSKFCLDFAPIRARNRVFTKNRLHDDFSSEMCPTHGRISTDEIEVYSTSISWIEKSPTRRFFEAKCALHGCISILRNSTYTVEFRRFEIGSTRPRFRTIEIASTRGNFEGVILAISCPKIRWSAQERCFWGMTGKIGSKTTHRQFSNLGGF